MNNSIYILVGELEGDYADYYERPTMEISASYSSELLEKVWENLPIKKRENRPSLRIYINENNEEWELIDYYIVKLPII